MRRSVWLVKQPVLLIADQAARAGRQPGARLESRPTRCASVAVLSVETLVTLKVQDRPVASFGPAETGWRPVPARQKVPCGALVWLYWSTPCQRVRLRIEIVVAELMLEGRGEPGDVDPLLVEIAIAVIGAAIAAGDDAVVELVDEEGDAVERRVVVVLVESGEGQPGAAADAEGDRRRDAPAPVALEIAAREVVAVEHRVEPHRDQCR